VLRINNRRHRFKPHAKAMTEAPDWHQRYTHLTTLALKVFVIVIILIRIL
jgi:hypothetical protein